MSNDKIKVEWTNPISNEKFIYKEKGDGLTHFIYGPKDTGDQKNHGHSIFDQSRNVIFNRNPKGE